MENIYCTNVLSSDQNSLSVHHAFQSEHSETVALRKAPSEAKAPSDTQVAQVRHQLNVLLLLIAEVHSTDTFVFIWSHI